jgi:hypothetical protein
MWHLRGNLRVKSNCNRGATYLLYFRLKLLRQLFSHVNEILYTTIPATNRREPEVIVAHEVASGG